MTLRQISVFLENKKGRLAEVIGLIAREKINIRALSLADTADFGVLRLIVNDEERCFAALKGAGFVAQKTEVIAVEVSDRPGGLQRVLAVLESGGINIEYMYAFVEKKGENAIVVFRIDQPEKGAKALAADGITVLTRDVVEKL
jgi:hypothetical protein